MTIYDYDVIESSLLKILKEMESQCELSTYYPDSMLSFEGNMEHIKEYIEVAGEYGLAYELIVVNLEQVPFILSGSAAINLLELGLIMKFKTDREEDKLYDLR
jgi:hypothetical protein